MGADEVQDQGGDRGLSALVEAACRQHRGQVATWQADGAAVSFASFFGTIIAFAERLAEEGVGPGTRVSIGFQDGIAGRMLALALLRLGATVLPSLAAHPGLEAEFQLLQHPRSLGGVPDLLVTPDWIRSPRRLVPIAAGGRMVMLTSGTTGLPKFRLFDDHGLAARLTRSSEVRAGPEGTVFNGYNPAATPGFSIGVRALLSGAALVNQPAEPHEWLAAMIRHEVRLACLPPGSFAPLLALAEAEGIGTLALQEIRVGGGALAPGLAARGEAVFGCPVVNTYGSNETGSIAHHRPALAGGLPGVVGHAYPDLGLRFLDDRGQPAEPEVGGVLWVGMPEPLWVRDYPSGEPLCDAEGWQDTGDLARLLPDGRLQLLGRVSDALNIGGNKIAPVRIEAMAEGFAGLREIAVFRAPTASGLDQVGLAVVADDGFDRTAFLAHMSGRLGRYFPLALHLMDRLPLNPAGKIDRAALTELHTTETLNQTQKVTPG